MKKKEQSAEGQIAATILVYLGRKFISAIYNTEVIAI